MNGGKHEVPRPGRPGDGRQLRHPGATDTDIDDKTERRKLESIEPGRSDETNPLLGGRPMTSVEVAEGIAFLLAPAAGAISGTEMWIDAASTLVRG